MHTIPLNAIIVGFILFGVYRLFTTKKYREQLVVMSTYEYDTSLIIFATIGRIMYYILYGA